MSAGRHRAKAVFALIDTAWRRFQLLYHLIDALNSESELSSFAFNRSITLLTERPAKKIEHYSVKGQGILRARVAC